MKGKAKIGYSPKDAAPSAGGRTQSVVKISFPGGERDLLPDSSKAGFDP